MTDPGKWLDSREFWKNKRVCVMRQHGAGFLGLGNMLFPIYGMHVNPCSRKC